MIMLLSWTCPKNTGIDELNLRTNSFQEKESDVNLGRHDEKEKNTKHEEVETLQRPITIGRLKRLEE
ncbi:hypothetical protein CR513_21718, partial [Mucuna pruriens]